MTTEKDWLCLFLGDTHTLGSTAIAIPGYPIASEEGRPYQASANQEWLYRCWWDCYKVVKQAAESYRIMLMLGGDLIDGPGHHGTFQTMGCRSDAIEMAIELLTPFNNLASGRMAVTGTTAHTGPAADEDRTIASELGAEIRDVWEDIEINGRKLWWSHHGIPVGQTEQNRDAGLAKWALDKDIECAKHPDRYRPDNAFAHDVHRSPDPVTRRGITVATSPCWQLPTRWAVQKFPSKQIDVGYLMWHPRSNKIYRCIYPKPRSPKKIIQ